MSEPVTDGATAPAASTPTAPVDAAATPVVAAAPTSPQPAPAAPQTPAQAQEAKPADKPYINPLARIAARAQSGQATSAAQAGELAARLTSVQTENDALRAAVKAHADASLASLPSDTLRNAVKARAGDDPTRTLDAIALLREAGVLAPVVAPPASTVPAVAAPAASPANDPDVAAYLEWKSAKDRGADLIASRLRLSYGAAIERGLAKQAPKN